MPYYSVFVPRRGDLPHNISATGSIQLQQSNSTTENLSDNITAATATSNTTNGDVSASDASIDNGSPLQAHFTNVKALCVFKSKPEALQALKAHKDARFREFNNEDDAIRYAFTGFENNQSQQGDIKTAATNAAAALEKAAFRAPTKQDLIKFRKTIESGKCDLVKKIIWDNPRYLVSSGDTPTTLKEGYRYNAMHVCANTNQPEIAALILETVSNPEFIDLLTGRKNTERMSVELGSNLLDYYLNIPEKGRSETPLHLASKNGHVEMIEVLRSYPQCKMTKNKEFALPKQIICSRSLYNKGEIVDRIKALFDDRYYVPVFRSNDAAIPPHIGHPFPINNPPNLNADKMSPEVKIQALAGPMNEDQAKKFCRRWKTPPRIGTTNTSSPLYNNIFVSPYKNINNYSSTPIKSSTNLSYNSSFDSFKNTANTKRRTLFTSHNNSFSGSENLKDAEFDTSYKYDQSIGNGPDEIDHVNDHVTNDDDDKKNGNHHTKQTLMEREEPMETDEAMETNNNNLINKINATNDKISLKKPLCPLTPLLKSKKDLFFTYREQKNNSPFIGTIDLNDSNYEEQPKNFQSPLLLNSNSACNDSETFMSPGLKERHIKITDIEKGLEVIGRELAKQENIGWSEYWDFLQEFVDISSSSGLLKFENYLKQCKNHLDATLQHNTTASGDYGDFSNTVNAQNRQIVALDDVRNVLEKLVFSKDATNMHKNNPTGKATMCYNTDRHRYEICEPTALSNTIRTSSLSSTTIATTTPAAAAVANDMKALLGSLKQNATTNVNNIGDFVAFPNSTNATTPYTYLEKSLQVYAKRMTKMIIQNVDNAASINETLLSELKRLKLLICSFKEDALYLNVNFSKVHSRIGNLVAIYLENSQEATRFIKYKIHDVIMNLSLPSGERREHLDCICSRIVTMLKRTDENILPENLKTEEMCSKVWESEEECDCQWDTNVSRKTSRRMRSRNQFKSRNPTTSEQSNAPRNDGTNTNAIEQFSDDDIFWSDFGSDSDDSNEEFLTPPESPSLFNMYNDEQQEIYKIFVCGDEPTKRDLDVLNAIFHVDIDENKYPHIHSWKTALLRYTNEEMDFFPTPSIVKKVILNQNTVESVTMSKRLFLTPIRTPAKAGIAAAAGGVGSSGGGGGGGGVLPALRTPLNRIRGLFTNNRTDAKNSSPLSVSSMVSPSDSSDQNDNSKNISLLNVSANTPDQ